MKLYNFMVLASIHYSLYLLLQQHVYYIATLFCFLCIQGTKSLRVGFSLLLLDGRYRNIFGGVLCSLYLQVCFLQQNYFICTTNMSILLEETL